MYEYMMHSTVNAKGLFIYRYIYYAIYGPKKTQYILKGLCLYLKTRSYGKSTILSTKCSLWLVTNTVHR